MKLAGWKRTVIAGLVTLSVVGAPVATMTAGHVSAATCLKAGGGSSGSAGVNQAYCREN